MQCSQKLKCQYYLIMAINVQVIFFAGMAFIPFSYNLLLKLYWSKPVCSTSLVYPFPALSVQRIYHFYLKI